MDGMTSRGEGRGVTSQYAAAVLYNGLGRYDEALAAPSWRASTTMWASWGVARGAGRGGRPQRPARARSDALERLSETTRAGGTDWALASRRARVRC